MKKAFPLSLLCAAIMLGSCKDKPIVPPTASNFQPITANSTWTYHVNNKVTPASSYDFTLKATAKDTSISSKTYRVFTNSSVGASNEYYYVAGTDYLQFAGFAGLTNSIELNYLKDAAVGTSWSETKAVNVAGVALTATFNYNIAEVLANYTVGSLNFTNVKKVHISLSVPGLTFSTQDLNFYYADGVGRVKSQIKLKAAFPATDLDNETNITAYNIAP